MFQSEHIIKRNRNPKSPSPVRLIHRKGWRDPSTRMRLLRLCEVTSKQITEDSRKTGTVKSVIKVLGSEGGGGGEWQGGERKEG
ncbi:hypothetical protein J6590_028251, partial [Homalodisca vitripennis]